MTEQDMWNKTVNNCFFVCVAQGFRQQALAVSTDPEHRFDLALQLGEVNVAYQLALEAEVRAHTHTHTNDLNPDTLSE